MSTTVRIRSEDKARLDRLQAQYLLKHGRRVPLDVVLKRMLEVAARHEDEVLAGEGGPSLTQAQKRKVLALPRDSGIATSSHTIDDELYGDGDN